MILPAELFNQLLFFFGNADFDLRIFLHTVVRYPRKNPNPKAYFDNSSIRCPLELKTSPENPLEKPLPSGLIIRPASDSDFAAIWPIFHAVVSPGDTYPYDPNTGLDEAYRLWMTPLRQKAFVAELDGLVVGTYILRPNQIGLGDHVANAGFMVGPEGRGRGVGRARCRHAIEEATRDGYRAMQFNYVISVNERAVRLWMSEGFRIVGTVPRALRHSKRGYVDAYIMHRFLNDSNTD